MRSGSMFRFDNPDGVEDEVSKAEVEIAEYTDFKYAVGMNSCGSCIFTALEAIGVQPGDKVPHLSRLSPLAHVCVCGQLPTVTVVSI